MVRKCEIYSSLRIFDRNFFTNPGPSIYKYYQTDAIAIPRHEMAKKMRFTKQEKGKLVKELEENASHSSTKTLLKEIESLKMEREKLNNDLINSQKMLNEKYELSKQQEDTVSELRTEIESLKMKHQHLSGDLDISKKLLKEKDEEIRSLINEKEKYETKCNEALSETLSLQEKIAKYDRSCHSLDSIQFTLSKTERKVYDRFLEYIDATTSMPHSLKSRVKAMQRMIASIQSYLSNSDGLVETCKHL